MKIPNNLFYTKEHEWIEFIDKIAIVGITDFAQSQLGDVIFIEFPQVGEELISGSSFGEIEAVKTVSDLYAPISGRVTNINMELDGAPELVNNDPYGKGWLVKIEPVNIKERDKLMNSDEYQKFVS
ncbi:MAG: glycine cleavage system protein H [Candidatus Marinimicrobia bacterium]|nr:glycine cleavage system protein H [Candidatus Neomarinimicrobiota bacterium]|tara:strand:+ start:326 stop:703 length:378 start_codon:yes stop_codon:yes gene_type:complete